VVRPLTKLAEATQMPVLTLEPATTIFVLTPVAMTVEDLSERYV